MHRTKHSTVSIKSMQCVFVFECMFDNQSIDKIDDEGNCTKSDCLRVCDGGRCWVEGGTISQLKRN